MLAKRQCQIGSRFTTRMKTFAISGCKGSQQVVRNDFHYDTY